MSQPKCRLSFCRAHPSHGASTGLCILHGFMFARSPEARVALTDESVAAFVARVEDEFNGKVKP